jgi:hypothetical protein
MPVNTIAMPAASAATISYLAAIEIAVPLRGSVPPVFAVWPAAVARDVCTHLSLHRFACMRRDNLSSS